MLCHGSVVLSFAWACTVCALVYMCALRCSCGSQRTGVDALICLVWCRGFIYFSYCCICQLSKFLGMLLSPPLMDIHAGITGVLPPLALGGSWESSCVYVQHFPTEQLHHSLSNLMLVIVEYQCALWVIAFGLVQPAWLPSVRITGAGPRPISVPFLLWWMSYQHHSCASLWNLGDTQDWIRVARLYGM